MKAKKTCPLACKAPKVVCVNGHFRVISAKPKPNSPQYKAIMKKYGFD